MQRHHFSSALQRMSTVARVTGLAPAGTQAEEVLCLVKGSPEAVGGLLLQEGGHGGKPSWYATYTPPPSPHTSPYLSLHLPCISPASPAPRYEATYRGLAEEGLRVLALAYKRCACDGAEPAEAAARHAQRPREWVESELSFAGFVAFGCPVREDSA